MVGDMRWNPITLRWEGNDAVLRDFESHVASSARPALITHLTGSSVAGGALGSLGSHSPNTSASSGFVTTGLGANAGARVVGNMLFDPGRMCWISRCPDEEEDVFAAFDEEDENADEEKGGTLRAVMPLPTSFTNSSSGTSSPARVWHGRTRSASTSGSENDSVPSIAGSSSASAYGSVRLSMASCSSGRLGSAEPDDIIEDVDEELVKACREAEARHCGEMKGWNLSSSVGGGGGGGSGRRERARSVSLEMEQPTGRDRRHLFEIRALATRKY